MNESLFSQLDILSDLGQRLRTLRLERNETQSVFAQRIGTSRITLGKMEKGSPNISIGLWISASIVLDRQDDWKSIFESRHDLFGQFEQLSKPVRLRARKKTS
jgi:DNA-binding XRE family transcriptional regulator